MGRRKGPIAADVESHLAWRDLMESHPYAPQEFAITAYLNAIVRRVDNEELASSLGAFESLLFIYNKLVKDDELIKWWNKISIESGDHISIPAWVFKELALGWANYASGSKGHSVGDAFGIGKGQGNRKNTREAVSLFRRDFSIALEVVNECVRASKTDEPISLEVVFEHVAKCRKISDNTVKRAYSKFKPIIKAFAEKHKVPIAFEAKDQDALLPTHPHRKSE